MKRINHGSELRNSPSWYVSVETYGLLAGVRRIFQQQNICFRQGCTRRRSFVIQSNHRAFSLLEIMLSIAIVAVIATGVIALDVPSQQRNDLDIVRNSMIQQLHSARSKARAVDGDTPWGMSIQASTFVLFKGTSYASRDTSYDEITELPQTLIPSGLSEIVFAKRTGDPLSVGTITITSKTNEQRTITINEKGTIDY